MGQPSTLFSFKVYCTVPLFVIVLRKGQKLTKRGGFGPYLKTVHSVGNTRGRPPFESCGEGLNRTIKRKDQKCLEPDKLDWIASYYQSKLRLHYRKVENFAKPSQGESIWHVLMVEISILK